MLTQVLRERLLSNNTESTIPLSRLRHAKHGLHSPGEESPSWRRRYDALAAGRHQPALPAHSAQPSSPRQGRSCRGPALWTAAMEPPSADLAGAARHLLLIP